ncbi:MAG: putative DNA binding domain-containing protein, partial [Candidatus Kuenenia sp.]|nr:putative DNA binding domain-containing protein [Candidatus Kuenenia sp.]
PGGEMMLSEQEILKLIAGGENSCVEFKEDTVDNKKLAKEIIALSNHKGGYLFLGVDDTGNISGITRNDNEERIVNICSDLIKPVINPAYYEMSVEGKRIGVLEIDNGCNKPYYLEDKAAKTNRYYMRYGSTTREVKHRDELQRLFQASQNIHYEIIPASSAKPEVLDEYEIKEYLKNNRSGIELSEENKLNLFQNLDLVTLADNQYRPTIAGLLLFGKDRVTKYLPQAEIMCVKVSGTNITDEKENLKFFERNVFDNFKDAVSFFYLYNKQSFVIEGVKRINFYDYPEKAFREILANAIIHRDYTIAGTGIAVWIYDDRVEIKSPGGLPNTITVEKMKLGIKYHRNPVLAQYFFDANMVERAGQGIPKSNRWLKENGNPELVIKEDEHEVVVIMFKRKEFA